MDHRFNSRWGLGFASLFFVFLTVALLPRQLSAQSQQQRDEWDLALVLYQNQILQHADLPKNTSWIYPFLDALETDAKDRQELTEYARAAQAVHNDYYYNKFMDLAEEAQINGNDVLKKANAYINILAEEPCNDYHCWVDLGFKVKSNGPILYKKALELKFDAEITREQARKLLNLGMDAMDRHGPWVDGEPAPNADTELYGIDTYIRQACPPFPLPAEYERATETMSRYLIDTLCKLPSGHQHYLDLAKKYGLGQAERYIEDFYAFVVGKVEIDRGEGPQPARGATVKVIDPNDNKTWTATAETGGNYVIEKVILHKKCSPFRVIAEYEGEKKEETFEGPLEKPDPAYRHEKNFLFKKTPPQTGQGNFLYKRTIDQKFPDVGDGAPGSYYRYTETITGQVSFDSYSNGRFYGKATIHYSRYSEQDSVPMTFTKISEEGTETVDCVLDYVWGSPRPSYSFETKEVRVQRHEEIVHRPFGGRTQWTETKDEPVSRSIQTGYVHCYDREKLERYALNLSGNYQKSDKDGEIICNWSFRLPKPQNQ